MLLAAKAPAGSLSKCSQSTNVDEQMCRVVRIRIQHIHPQIHITTWMKRKMK